MHLTLSVGILSSCLVTAALAGRGGRPGHNPRSLHAREDNFGLESYLQRRVLDNEDLFYNYLEARGLDEDSVVSSYLNHLYIRNLLADLNDDIEPRLRVRGATKSSSKSKSAASSRSRPNTKTGSGPPSKDDFTKKVKEHVSTGGSGSGGGTPANFGGDKKEQLNTITTTLQNFSGS